MGKIRVINTITPVESLMLLLALILAVAAGIYLMFFWALPPANSAQPKPVHPVIAQGQYVFDKRTDLCYYVTTINGSTDFVLVPCTDKVMRLATGGI